MGQNAVMAYVMGLRLVARPGTTPDGMPKNALTSELGGRRRVARLGGVAGEAGVARRIRQGDVEDDVLAELLDGRQRHDVGRLLDGGERPVNLPRAGSGEQEHPDGEGGSDDESRPGNRSMHIHG